MARPCRVDAGHAGVAGLARAIVCHGRIAMLPMGGIGRRRQTKDHPIMADRLGIFWWFFGRIGVRLLQTVVCR